MSNMATAEMFAGIEIQQKRYVPKTDRLNIVVVGAGLGGLGAAIGLLLAGHEVHVLESASQIGEVGAGIQALPNSSRVLIQWGLGSKLSSLATIPLSVEMLGWRGNIITQHNFTAAAQEYGAPFWDFHRADLHGALLERAQELGCTFQTRARVVDVETTESGAAIVLLASGESIPADLVIGADGISSRCREIMLGGPSPPVTTGDLAYRVLLSTEAMRDDPDLAPLLDTHHVRYWMGPGAHAVSYVLRHGKLINIVLLVPDDMPAGASTMSASVEEMQALFAKWDARIPKMLKYCQSVQKWRLCYRPGMAHPWYNEAGTFALLGDAVHATLPYLASGAGMALEDGAVLGHCFARVSNKSPQAKKQALTVYEKCRRARTERIVDRSNLQQHLYHIDDGEEQEARDSRFRLFGQIEQQIQGERLLPGSLQLPDGLENGSDPLAWRRYGVGDWLITYDCLSDVQRHWPGEQSTGNTSQMRASL